MGSCNGFWQEVGSTEHASIQMWAHLTPHFTNSVWGHYRTCGVATHSLSFTTAGSSAPSAGDSRNYRCWNLPGQHLRGNRNCQRYKSRPCIRTRFLPIKSTLFYPLQMLLDSLSSSSRLFVRSDHSFEWFVTLKCFFNV